MPSKNTGHVFGHIQWMMLISVMYTHDLWLGQTNLLLRFIGGMVGYYNYILSLRCFT